MNHQIWEHSNDWQNGYPKIHLFQQERMLFDWYGDVYDTIIEKVKCNITSNQVYYKGDGVGTFITLPFTKNKV